MFVFVLQRTNFLLFETARLSGISTRAIRYSYLRALPMDLATACYGWTADAVGVLGGDSGVTPGFDRTAQEGLLFTIFYSTGFRTEQRSCARISSFSSRPRTTIICLYGRFDQLPSSVNVLASAGDHSTYYYAGDVTFANTRIYLEAAGFAKVPDENSFRIKQRT